MNTTSSITFYCRKSKTNASGLACIEVCVRLAGERITSTLPRRCAPAEFRRMIQSRTQNPIKQYTTAVATKIEQLITKCLIEGRSFTKEILRTNIQYGFVEYHCTVGDLFHPGASQRLGPGRDCAPSPPFPSEDSPVRRMENTVLHE